MSLTIKQLGMLKLGRYEIHLRARVNAVLPPFLGSTLRGAFGHALKAIACSMPHQDCGRCLLVERCLYPRLFETAARNGRSVPAESQRPVLLNGRERPEVPVPVSAQPQQPVRLLKRRQDAPRPFIFIPPLPAESNGFMSARDDLLRWRVAVKAGEPIVFGLSLFGEAIQELPYVIYAISLMAQHGFGVDRAPFVLEQVAALDAQGNRKVIYKAESNHIEEHQVFHSTLGRLVQARMAELALAAGETERALALAAGASTVSTIRNPQSAIRDSLSLRFNTPTRLRIRSQVVENPTFAQLVSSVSLRLSMLAETCGDAPLNYDYKSMIERAREVSTRESTLRLMALDRRSNSQRRKLEMDGFMGDVTFAGSGISDLLPLIVAGEFLNVGSGTAFGLGRYTIVS